MKDTAPHSLASLFARRRPFKASGRATVTAIDLENGLIHVAQSVRRGNRIEMVRVASESLDQPNGAAELDAAAKGEAVARALHRLNLKVGPLAMAVPRNQVMLRTLSLPAANSAEELASMVHFQISKDLPFRPEEAVIDFAIQGASSTPRTTEPSASKDGNGQSSAPDERGTVDVLVAIVKKDVVQQYAELAHAGGLKLVALGLASHARAHCLSVCRAVSGSGATALISISRDQVITDFLTDQGLVFSRTAAMAARAETAPAGQAQNKSTSIAGEQQAAAEGPVEAERAYPDAVAIEVIRSLHSYEGLEAHQPVEKLLVAGDTGEESKVVCLLGEQLHLPCELLDLSAIPGLGAGDHVRSSGALTAVGLAYEAQEPTGLPFDFLSPKGPPVPRNWRRIKVLVGVAVAGTLMMSLWGVRAQLIQHRQQIKTALQTELTKAEKNRALYRNMRTKAKTVRDWTGENRDWLDHFAYLSTLLPPCTDVYLTTISTGTRGEIHLSAKARSGEILAQMDKRLRAAGYQLKPLAINPGNDRYGYGFQSAVKLTLTNKLKIDKTLLTADARPTDDGSLDAPRGRVKPKPAEPAPVQVADAPAPERPKSPQAVRSDPVPFRTSVADPGSGQTVEPPQKGRGGNRPFGPGQRQGRGRRMQP